MATNVYIENYLEGVKVSAGIKTKKPVTLSGTAATLAVGGTSTFTGVATFTAAPVFNGGRTSSVVDVTTATVTLTAAQSGALVLMDRAAGCVITLPAPTVGLVFDFIVVTTVTSNTYKVITDAGTTLATGSLLGSSDNLASKSFIGNGTSHIAVIQNSASSNATGGIIGSKMTWQCVTATLWEVNGTLVASSTPTSPWSTT